MRERLGAHPRLFAAAWIAAYGGAAAGVVLALAGHWLVGALVFAGGVALLWACRQWTLPRSRDAYLRRVADVWSDWAVLGVWEYRRVDSRAELLTSIDRVDAAARAAVGKLERMTAPVDLELQHRELVDVFARYRRLVADLRDALNAADEPRVMAMRDHVDAAVEDMHARVTRIASGSSA